MSGRLKIKEVASQWIHTATLRYYEQIGLLPEASRNAAGTGCTTSAPWSDWRSSPAKQLGCSLEEIAGLTTAWDGGQCGPIQDQLRRLVAGKIAAAQQQIVELTRFTDELQHAAVALERHRPDGACDSDCGCVSDSVEDQPVAAPSRRST